MTKSKIAIVQSGSIIYDTPATIDKLEKLTEEAANGGAELVLFPGEFLAPSEFRETFSHLMTSTLLQGLSQSD